MAESFFMWFARKIPAIGTLRNWRLTFVSVFFATFYMIFLAYKLLKNEKFGLEDIFLLLANSAIFYSLGYAILNRDNTGHGFLGLIYLVNALVHPQLRSR